MEWKRLTWQTVNRRGKIKGGSGYKGHRSRGAKNKGDLGQEVEAWAHLRIMKR